jgi:hypothetical protein
MNIGMRAWSASALVALCVLSGCGSSSSTGHIKGSTYNRSDTCKSNQFVGNRHSHALHRPGAKNLPSTKNQVCFDSLTAAKKAGYHLAR